MRQMGPFSREYWMSSKYVGLILGRTRLAEVFLGHSFDQTCAIGCFGLQVIQGIPKSTDDGWAGMNSPFIHLMRIVQTYMSHTGFTFDLQFTIPFLVDAPM